MKLRFLFLAAPLLLAACGKKPMASPPTSAPPESVTAPSPPAASGDTTRERPEGAGGNRTDFAQRAQGRMERMKTDLGLSEDQQKKIQDIMNQQMTMMQAARAQGGSNDREALRARFREAREAANAQIEALLTPEQKTKWEELRKQRQQEMTGRRENRSSGNRTNNAPPD